MNEPYTLELSGPLLLHVGLKRGETVPVDVYKVNEAIAKAHDLWTEDADAESEAIKKVVEDAVGFPLSENQLLEMVDAVVEIIKTDNEERKKKVGAIVNSQRTTRESHADSSDGTSEKS
jgi:hypothetical protein